MASHFHLVLQTLLQQTAVLKLNGGLGTSMGLEKAKSLLPVKDGKTFLDLIAEQIVYTREKFGSKVRFILMNRCPPASPESAILVAQHESSGSDMALAYNTSLAEVISESF